MSTVEAVRFSFMVQGTSFNFMIHAHVNGMDLKISHFESGRGVCEVSVSMLALGGFDWLGAATIAMCELVSRIGVSKVRTTLEGATPL